MSKIARVHDKAEMRKAWEGIFASDIYFHYPFQPQIECCLLYPHTDGGRLSEDQYRAVTEAARAAGDRGFYYSETEFPSSFDNPDHWWCEFPTYEEYHSLHSGLIETAAYSRDSSWGVALAHDWYTLVGGSEDFIRHIDESCPVWRQGVIETIDEWDYTITSRDGTSLISLAVELLAYWNKYPADEWVTTLTRNIEYQLREYWQKRAEGDYAEWAVRLAEKMNVKLDEP